MAKLPKKKPQVAMTDIDSGVIYSIGGEMFPKKNFLNLLINKIKMRLQVWVVTQTVAR